MHFNPRSPHGERLLTDRGKVVRKLFQSTLPARGATITRLTMTFWQRSFQSTLPARGATRKETTTIEQLIISIHAPRTGSDTARIQIKKGASISIHAPRTGSDDGRVLDFGRADDFNPRSPHGERQQRTIWA